MMRAMMRALLVLVLALALGRQAQQVMVKVQVLVNPVDQTAQVVPQEATTPPPQTPPPTPAPEQSPGSQLIECVLLPNTNAQGDTVADQRDVSSSAECCAHCQTTQGCNVFVFCALQGGCDDGSGTGTRYPQGTCTLKTQALTPGSQPAFWATGMVVPWESGYIS